ncbi:alpha/beta hydrolase [Butyrivibrio sp. XBB1001]|uniref:alpha/beta hydrolase n=1 Tax=Butyrivibrio sp. XBB1001 TaxID=1280682 RepID=UPI00040BED2B|nr:alpha/beta hydrolase [Butyrivibrio sp. XBB1001]
MKEKQKLTKVFLVSLAVFFIGLIIAYSTMTDGGNVEMRRLSVMTDRGVAISLEVFKPKSATRENPAPAVMLIPGGNASVEYMSDAGMELARRNIVAIGIEPYTIGRSDVEKDNDGLGSIDVTDYVYGLDFIDTTNIGYIGWSMGASRVNAALYVPDPSGEMVKDDAGNESPKMIIRDGVKGVMYVGAGGLLTNEYQINSALFEGEWDNLYRGDRREMNKNPQYTEVLGVDQFDFWKWYGDPASGTGRIYYEGWTGHVAGLASPSFVKAACDFYTTTFNLPNNKPILFMWKELGTALSFIAVIIAMICVVSFLIDLDFFKEDLVTKERVVLEASPKKWFVCLGLVLPALFGAATAAWAVPTGQGILNKWVSKNLVHGTNIQNVNGLVFWLCCLQLFGLLLFIIMNFAIVKADKKALKEQITLPGTRMAPMLLKGVLFSFLSLLFVYFIVTFGEQLFAISPRLWKVQLNSLTRLRMEKFLMYFPLYLIPFLVANYLHSTSFYIKDKPVVSTILFWLANGLPPMFFLLYAYGKIAFLHTTPITSLGMSRANGSLVDAAIMMIPVGILASILYRKTKNFYLPAIFNSMFFTWMAVATDLIFVGK